MGDPRGVPERECWASAVSLPGTMVVWLRTPSPTLNRASSLFIPACWFAARFRRIGAGYDSAEQYIGPGRRHD